MGVPTPTICDALMHAYTYDIVMRNIAHDIVQCKIIYVYEYLYIYIYIYIHYMNTPL